MAHVAAYISNVFGRSPFGGLQIHAKGCAKTARELIPLFDAANDARWEDVDQLYQQIADLENQADDQKRLVRSTLPRGFFLPVARADLLDLVGRQDKIANRSRDIAGLVHGRRLQFPVEVQPKIAALVSASAEICSQVGDVVSMLDELMESGFKGIVRARVLQMIDDVERKEHEADGVVVEIRSKLFLIENDLPAVHVMFLYAALDEIAGLADDAERVAHRVQMMLAR